MHTANIPKHKFDEAIDLVRNEFTGLCPDQNYRNGFSRLLKWDPLGRVTMLGTDQRDYFIPLLRETLQSTLKENGHVFDFGAGDGQTFRLVSDLLPPCTTVSLEEPNEKYAESYVRWLEEHPTTKPGIVIGSGFDEMDEYVRNAGIRLPDRHSQCLCLALHMIYFMADLEEGICKLYDYLRPGGKMFIVFADETVAYTGQITRAYYKQTGQSDKAKAQLQTAQNRLNLLLPTTAQDSPLHQLLTSAFPQYQPCIQATHQPSRFYTHTLADLLALCNITELFQTSDGTKYETAKQLLINRPEILDFRIETNEGPRMGMFSVSQPQIVTVIEKSLTHRCL